MTKQDFFKRIRSALHRHEGSPFEAPPALLEPISAWDNLELVPIFQKELEVLTGKFHLVHSVDEARVTLNNIIADIGAKSYIRSIEVMVDDLVRDILIPIATNKADADVGITGVRCAIAQTGTIVLTSDAGRLASLLPMTHIAIVRAEQLVPTMTEAFEKYMDLPTAWVQATGPSRTADIEQTLEIGVHGPGVVHVIMIE